jgi:endoglucanase
MKERFIACLVALAFIIGMTISFMPVKAQAAPITSSDFLKANGKVLRKNYGTGEVVQLRGTNAGGWLVQEFWMTPTEYSTGVTCEMDIYNTLMNRFGEAKMRELVKVYQDNYWTTSDFDNCAALGINCIRLPIWYMNLVDFNGNYLSNAFEKIDWFIQQAGQRGIYVILDLHGAPGSQNGSDHSGIDGGDNKEAASQFFFGSNAYNNQQKFYDIWYRIAQRYKGNPTVAGYDLLNEPYCTYRYTSSYPESTLHSMLWDIYNNAYNVIRSVDPDHVIIMEATWDPWDLPDPSQYGWTNVMYEYHNYLYDDYDNANGGQVQSLRNKINLILNQNYNVPSYMGEFCLMNNTSAWQQGLQLLNDSGLSWTTWTYKVTGSNNNWGLYNQNVAKVNVSTDSEATIRSKWSNVGSSTPNTALINAIKPYFTQGQTSLPTASIPNGEYYITAIANNMVVCADNYGNNPLVANRSAYGGAWESFTVVNNSDGTISLKAGANNNYVCAVIDESSQLLARSAAINTWEKFIPYKINDTQIALKSVANNSFVKADLNNGAVLYATSSTVAGAWEAFTITPVNPTPTGHPIPGKIEAEDYSSMYGIQTESCSEGGLNVGYLDTGDWMDYNVNVSSAGSYTFQFRVASTGSSGQLQLRSGSTTLATVNIPNTGGWQNWQTVTATVSLNAGSQTLRIYVSGPSFNINYFNVTAANNNVVWFRNFEATGGISAGSNATVASYTSSANPGGTRCARLTVSSSGDPGTNTRCLNVTPQSGSSVNATGKNYLIFFVNDTQGANTIRVTIIDTNNAVWSGWTSAQSVKNQWTKITVPLSSVTGINKAAIKEIRLGEWNSGTYYFDDIYFATNSTDGIPSF